MALTGDVARTALEAGNSPKMIFRGYREVVDKDAARRGGWARCGEEDAAESERHSPTGRLSVLAALMVVLVESSGVAVNLTIS